MRVSTYDILSGRIDRDAVWIEAVQGFGNAYERMTRLAAQQPGPYFIFCQKTHTICGSIDTTLHAHHQNSAPA